MNHKHPPELPPRSSSAEDPAETGAQHGLRKDYFDRTVRELHDSLMSKMIEYHSGVEQVMEANKSHTQAERVQASYSTGPLVAELWTLLQGTRTLQEFARNPVGEIRQRLSVLEEERDRLRAERKDLEDERMTARNKAIDAQATIKTLLEKNMKYREIFTKSMSDSAELPDEKIHSQFVELRSLIQQIVHKYLSAQRQVPLSKHQNPFFEDQRRFRQDLENCGTAALQIFRMRAKLFELVNDRLLSQSNFGIRDSEESLTVFERALTSAKTVPHEGLVEWRSRTIEIGAGLAERSRRPSDACDDIIDFFDPQVPGASFDQFEKSVLGLCNKAYDLSLLWRKSRNATFKIITAKDETLVTAANEAEISCQLVEGPGRPDLVGSRIMMTVFGGLEKSSGGSDEERTILEKPHVVCHT